tara:strand:- start:4134 stop:4511 length:378 start_codon:yes stop_codon:yes gene_type:complete
MVDVVKLHHVSFAVRNLDASKQFFGEVLQLPEIERPNFQFSGVWYAIGDRQLHLIAETCNANTDTVQISRSDHMALEVLDIEAVKEVLDKNGIEYGVGNNSNLGMDQAFCRDPDGHVIEFVYYHF